MKPSGKSGGFCFWHLTPSLASFSVKEIFANRVFVIAFLISLVYIVLIQKKERL